MTILIYYRCIETGNFLILQKQITLMFNATHYLIPYMYVENFLQPVNYYIFCSKCINIISSSDQSTHIFHKGIHITEIIKPVCQITPKNKNCLLCNTVQDLHPDLSRKYFIPGNQQFRTMICLKTLSHMTNLNC